MDLLALSSQGCYINYGYVARKVIALLLNRRY